MWMRHGGGLPFSVECRQSSGQISYLPEALLSTWHGRLAHGWLYVRTYALGANLVDGVSQTNHGRAANAGKLTARKLNKRNGGTEKDRKGTGEMPPK
jgi:hypothetical protein